MWHVRPQRIERITLVEINGIAVTFNFPIRRNGNGAPVTVVKLRVEMGDRNICRLGYPMKFPVAVETSFP